MPQWLVHPGAWLLTALALLCSPQIAQADGLRVGMGFAAMNYSAPDGGNVDVYYGALSTRVSRGRAGLSFSVPYMGISGGSIAVSGENLTVSDQGDKKFRSGLSDMQAGLDYNIYQNRPKMIIVTLSGSLRFPTGGPGLGSGVYFAGTGLSATYGITRQLIAFADLRNEWQVITTPVAQRSTSGELGAIYWFTERFGTSASLFGANYAGVAKPILQLNLGVNFELFPGFMTNLNGIGGFFGGAPRGISFGFGFEL